MWQPPVQQLMLQKRKENDCSQATGNGNQDKRVTLSKRQQPSSPLLTSESRPVPPLFLKICNPLGLAFSFPFDRNKG